MDNTGFTRDDSTAAFKEIFLTDTKDEMGNGDGNLELKDGKQTPAESGVTDVHQCGLFCCTPKWMQPLKQPKCLLAALCLLSCIQGFVVNGVNNVNTTSYERRFQLTASQASSISSAYDFAAGILVLPASYFGTFMHKPRLVAFAALALGLGSFSMALPHFTTGLYEAGEGINKLCNATASSCDSSGVQLSNYLYLLIFGQILHGVGGTTLYTVGIAALDDNVNNKMSPLYLGIMYAFAALGPALGYVLGGQFLSLYVDYDSGVTTSLSREDPRWVGAWWIGFVVSFLLCLLTTLIFFFFPRETPATARLRKERVNTNPKGREQANISMNIALRKLPTATLRLLRSPTFILISLGGATEGMVTSGFATFLPKFIKNQFNQTDNMSAILTGALGVPGIAGGQFLGGYIMKKKNWDVKNMLRWNSAVSIIALIMGACLFAHCTQTKVAGVNLPYSLQEQTSFSLNMTDSCNAQCSCNVEHYDPVCYNNVEFLTPCYAGCRHEIQNGSAVKEYRDCSCIEMYHPSVNTTRKIVSGKCSNSSCSLMYVFLPFLFLIMFSTFLAGTPAASATMRCVADQDKSYALGVQWVFIRFIGTVPGPLMFGAIIDSICVLWQTICGIRRSCWIYDNSLMSQYLFYILLVCKLFSAFFFFLGSFLYKPKTHTNTVDTLQNINTDSTEAKQTTGL